MSAQETIHLNENLEQGLVKLNELDKYSNNLLFAVDII